MNLSVACDTRPDWALRPVVEGCRRSFDFTLAFEQSIFSIGTSGVLLLLLPLRITQLLGRTRKTVSHWLLTAKLLCVFIFGALQLALLVLWANSADSRTRVSIPAACLAVLDALSLALLSVLEHERSSRPSPVICLYLFFSILLDLAQVRTLWLQLGRNAIAGVFTASVVTKGVLLFLESHEKRAFLKSPYREYPPEALASIMNTSVFYWINQLMLRGYSAVMGVKDLFVVDRALASDSLEKTVLGAWSSQDKDRRFALLQVLLSCFMTPLLKVVIPRLCLIGFRFSQPLLINRAIRLIEAPETPYNRNVGYGLIGATILIYIGLAVSNATYQHQLYRFLTMIRGGLICLIYDTTLGIDANAANNLAAVTLMSTDIDRIAAGFVSLDSMWANPIEAGIAIYLLKTQLGVACVAPVVISLGCTISALSIMKWASNSQKEWVAAVEKRVATTAAVLGSIKGVKIHGLTDRLSEVLQTLRVKELDYAKRYRINMICTAVVSNVTNLCGPLLTFMMYVLVSRATTGATLHIAQAFTSLSLISLLSTPVSSLVQAIPTFAAATGCLGRIQAYIKTEPRGEHRLLAFDGPNSSPLVKEPVSTDIEASSTEKKKYQLENIPIIRDLVSKDDIVIEMERASIGYRAQGENILHNIDLKVKRGSLTLITGPVGCGKSTLSKGLLGELFCNTGTIKTKVKEIAYCAQDSWLPNSTIREVVLGGALFDEEWYQTVIQACALRTDLMYLHEGDQTVIGSKGASLSGGQKQRLALARAIYARKQLLVLDSVLSGLDTKTDESVVQAVLGANGLCKQHKITVVLVTHAAHHARSADHIVVLGQNGTVLNQGSYEQVLHQNANLGKLLVQMPAESEDETDTPKTGASGKSEDIPAESFDSARRSGDLSVYLYLLRSIGWGHFILFSLSVALFSLSSDLQAVLLQYWSGAESTNPGVCTNMYLGFYGMLAGLSLVGLLILSVVMLLWAGPKSSIRLHAILLKTTMSAPLDWFISTDSGTTLNRFSQDMSLIDMDLLLCLMNTVVGVAMVATEAVLIVLGAKWAALALPLIFGILYPLQRVYLRTSRQLRHLDLETKAPLYSHFLETSSGLATIRAFGWQDQMAIKNRELLDLSQRPFYLLYCVQRWLGLVLDLIVAGVAIVLMTLATQVRSTTSSGALGVALINVLNFNITLGFLIRQWTALETSIGAIARVKGFERDMVSEDRPEEKSDHPIDWPVAGELEIGNVSVVYKPDTPSVLHDISIRVPAGQRVGIVGRTGSGKSSLLLTLLRLTNLEGGNITVDGIDLSSLRRSTVCRALVSVAQEPCVIPGTVRFNADPFSTLPDNIITTALNKAGLWTVVEANGGLDADMDSLKLSRGQQQLFGLAQALCKKAMCGSRNHGVLLLDEMTSNVDAQTEQTIRGVLSEAFHGWTMLSVTHKLDALADYDRVIVLDQGRVAEDGDPRQLRQLAGGRFRDMCEAQGR